ncbi:MAG: sulfotransferase family 2 domain-containing protein [Synechococcales cyanobacterium T60_A2020_003]|nr:sulfotransferase family 2 domain-containing protein [Synechococcales cyanobacterium T60_A2020_003]
MLSPDDLLYFIHIPKTAGTTLITLLDSKFDVNEIFPAQLWKELAKIPPDEVGKYRLYRGHFGARGLEPFLPKPPVCITMLRQPIPLSLSTYKFVMREPGTRVHSLAVGEKMSFTDFIQHPKTRKRISNKQTRNLSFKIKYPPADDSIFHYAESRDLVDQWLDKYQLSLSDRDSLSEARAQLDACAFFGLVERFDESMALMSYTFGWSPVGTVPKLREATTPAEIEALSDDVRAMLEECNRLDTKLYRYAEKVFEKRMRVMMRHLSEFAKPGEPEIKAWTDDPQFANILLDRYYADCQRQVLKPSPRIQVDFSQALSGSGWHQRETMAMDHSTFRWTGPATTTTIDLPIPQKADAEITFRVINAIEMDVLDSLKLAINNKSVDLELLDGAGSTVRTYQAIAPQSILASDRPFTRLSFIVNRTIAPHTKESWNPDVRKLGVAIHWIEVKSHQTDDLPSEEQTSAVNVSSKTHQFAGAKDIIRYNQRIHQRDRIKSFMKTAPVLRSLYHLYKRLTAQ